MVSALPSDLKKAFFIITKEYKLITGICYVYVGITLFFFPGGGGWGGGGLKKSLIEYYSFHFDSLWCN